MLDSNIGKICRLCLTNSNDVITLFSDFSTELKIIEILEKHFYWFKVDINDSFSNNICKICWSKVDTFHRFYIEVKSTHDTLSDSHRIDVKSEFSCDVEINDFLSTESPVQSDDDKQTVAFSHSEPITTPKKRRGPKKKSTTTAIVSKTSTTATEIDEVENSKQELAEKRNEEDQRIREFYNLKCDLCDTKSNTFIEVRAHYRIEHQLRRGYLTCCKRKFFYRGEILEHMYWHLNPDAFKCTVCSKSYPTKWKLDLHMHYHAPDNEKIYCCDICNKKYSKKCQVKQHIYLIHAFAKELKCEQCNKLFRLNSQLMAHIRNVHENANQRMCDICAKVFKSKFQSDLHRRTEHPINGEEEKFQCTQCGQIVKHHRALRRHMIRHHSEIKSYSCDQCDKIVSTKDALRTHVRHTHESHPAKHKCDICGKCFHKLLILREHIATHTGAILYRCDWCSKPFRSIANKYSHLRKVHPIEWELNRATKKPKTNN